LKLTYLGRGLSDFDEIWHDYAVRHSFDRSDRQNFQILKIQDGGGRHLEKSKNRHNYLGRSSSDFYEIWHTDALITTCPGIDIALEGGFN